MSRGFRVGVVPLVAALLLQSTAGIYPAHAQTTARIEGKIYATTGDVGDSFRVILRDLETGQEIVSAPATSAGKFTVSATVNKRYELAGAVAPDGTRFPLRDVVSFTVPEGGIRIDVRFSAAEGVAAEPDVTPPPAEQPTPNTTPRTTQRPVPTPHPGDVVIQPPTGGAAAFKPWWKRKLVVGAIVVGVFGGFVAAASSDDDRAASPY